MPLPFAILNRALAPCAVAALVACAGPDRVVASRAPEVAPATGAAHIEWSPPVNLGPLINSSGSELQLGIAPNGRSLYVSSDRPGTLGSQDLWVSQLQPDGAWGELVNLGAVVNSPQLESSPTVTLDGHYLYFSSRRGGGFGGLDCWRSYRADPGDDFAWEAPENLGPPVNSTYDDADCLPRRAGGDGPATLWFTSLNRPEGQGDWDIYTSEIRDDGTFGPATPVPELDTPFRETRLTITGNGLDVVFTSNRPGGLGGIDMWTAHRPSPRHAFCPPVNLGAPINSSANDRSPSISTNGDALYFTSTRPGGFSLGSDDVYMAARESGMGPPACTP